MDSLKIDSSVAAWLWDIRYTGEKECTSILLAKSILPPVHSLNSSIYEDSCRSSSRRRLKMSESLEPELILGGTIPVGPKADSLCSELDSGCGISLLPELGNPGKTPVTLQDSAFNSSETESEQPRKDKTPLRLLGQEEDNSSLDSACGSSPVHSLSQNNSPVRTVSPPLNEPVNALHHAGIPFLPAYPDLRGKKT